MVNPFPAGARYDTLVGPRCRSQSAPPMAGAVAENPKISESRPAWTVSSIPARDDSDGAFLKYAPAMFRSHSSTRGVVPRLRKTWLEGDVDENKRPTSMNPPYCHSIGA